MKWIFWIASVIASVFFLLAGNILLFVTCIILLALLIWSNYRMNKCARDSVWGQLIGFDKTDNNDYYPIEGITPEVREALNEESKSDMAFMHKMSIASVPDWLTWFDIILSVAVIVMLIIGLIVYF
jgi:hypothetical protein